MEPSPQLTHDRHGAQASNRPLLHYTIMSLGLFATTNWTSFDWYNCLTSLLKKYSNLLENTALISNRNSSSSSATFWLGDIAKILNFPRLPSTPLRNGYYGNYFPRWLHELQWRDTKDRTQFLPCCTELQNIQQLLQ